VAVFNEENNSMIRRRFARTVLAVLVLALPTCGREGGLPRRVASVYLLSDGTVRFNGSPIATGALPDSLAAFRRRKGARLWYARESVERDATPDQLAMLEKVMAVRLPITFVERGSSEARVMGVFQPIAVPAAPESVKKR
jgi:hypothetical protein